MVKHIHTWSLFSLFLLVAALGFTGCDGETTTTGPGPGAGEYDLGQYGWAGTGTMRYIAIHEGNSQRSFHTLDFQVEGDSILATDVYSNADGGIISTEWFSYRSDASVFTLSSYTSQALVNLPVDMRMHGSIAGDSTVLTCLATLSTEDVLAGTADGGVMKFNIREQRWVRLAGLDAPMPIKKILVPPASPQYIYAMTDFALWYSTDAGTVWSKVQRIFSTKITDIAVHNGTTLVVGYNNWLDISEFPFQYWTPIDIRSIGLNDNISALGLHGPGTYSMLYIGTTAGEVHPLTIANSNISPLGAYYTSSYGSPVTALIVVQNSPIRTFLITQAGNLSVEFLSAWVENRSITACLTAAAVSQQDKMLVGTATGVYLSDISYYGTELLTGFGAVPHLVYTGSYHVALTAVGPLLTQDDGLTWQSADEGLRAPATFTGLELLPSGMRAVGDDWDAGLVEQSPGGPLHTYTMKGTVTLHLDELWTPEKDAMYRDVVLVHYTLEPTPPSNASGSSSNWKIYYAKDLGPVMIQEYNGSQLISTSYLETTTSGV